MPNRAELIQQLLREAIDLMYIQIASMSSKERKRSNTYNHPLTSTKYSDKEMKFRMNKTVIEEQG